MKWRTPVESGGGGGGGGGGSAWGVTNVKYRPLPLLSFIHSIPLKISLHAFITNSGELHIQTSKPKSKKYPGNGQEK